jgi:hypothetical protein
MGDKHHVPRHNSKQKSPQDRHRDACGIVMVPVFYVAVIKTTQIFRKRLEANA